MNFIQIDDREGDLMKEYDLQKFSYQKSHMVVGDLALNQIVIERKTTTDFLDSIADQRLISQCKYMLQNYQKVVIIIEGNLDEAMSKRVFNRNAVLGMIASIIARNPISVVFSPNIQDTTYLSYKLLIKGSDGKSFRSETINRSEHRDKRLDILTLIDGVSLEKAKLVVAQYPLFKLLVDAPIEDLKAIKGIGPKLAENIISFFSIFRN